MLCGFGVKKLGPFAHSPISVISDPGSGSVGFVLAQSGVCFAPAAAFLWKQSLFESYAVAAKLLPNMTLQSVCSSRPDRRLNSFGRSFDSCCRGFDRSTPVASEAVQSRYEGYRQTVVSTATSHYHSQVVRRCPSLRGILVKIALLRQNSRRKRWRVEWRKMLVGESS